MQLVGGVAYPDVKTHFLSLLPEPQPTGVTAADPSEVVLGEAVDRSVIDHASGVVAHGRVDDLADGQLADVAGHAGLEKKFGIGAHDLVLAQRRQVDDSCLLAGGPVLVESAVVGVAVGQPVARVLREVASELRGSGVESRLLGQFGVGIG